MEFSVSEEYKASGPAFESTYDWKVTNEKYPNDSFKVTRSTKGEYTDNFFDVIFKEDITKYYEDIVKSYWSNVKVDVRLVSYTTNESYDMDDYNDYLSKQARTQVGIYLNYDEGFDYETEAKKIYNLLEEESKYSRDLEIFVQYLDREQFNSKSIEELYELTKYEVKENYFKHIRTFNFESSYETPEEISVQSIIDDMKKSAEEVYEHNNNEDSKVN